MECMEWVFDNAWLLLTIFVIIPVVVLFIAFFVKWLPKYEKMTPEERKEALSIYFDRDR